MQEKPAVLFFDVDGTLVWHDPAGSAGEGVTKGEPSPGVREAFARLRERGHLAYICTGRPRCLVQDSLLDLHPAGLITSAGACVYQGDTCLYERRIEPELLEKTVRLLWESGAEVLLEGPDVCYSLLPHGGNYDIIPSVNIRSLDELGSFADLHINKFSYESYVMPLIDELRDQLEPYFTLSDLGVGTGEASRRGVDKGVGVAHALELLGRTREGTFAFGDSENDLPMLAAVETPVAMGNALPQVKERASYVTLSVQDDGVPAALEHFGLI